MCKVCFEVQVGSRFEDLGEIERKREEDEDLEENNTLETDAESNGQSQIRFCDLGSKIKLRFQRSQVFGFEDGCRITFVGL